MKINCILINNNNYSHWYYLMAPAAGNYMLWYPPASSVLWRPPPHHISCFNVEIWQFYVTFLLSKISGRTRLQTFKQIDGEDLCRSDPTLIKYQVLDVEGSFVSLIPPFSFFVFGNLLCTSRCFSLSSVWWLFSQLID